MTNPSCYHFNRYFIILINELSYMTLPEHPFLDIEENQLFCQKVFAFLQLREHKIQIHGEHYQEHIEKSVQMLNE
ncbi:YxiF family protein [Bacillus safensis]|uniref:YxiF family protein n=1 Tax=Bacillus safensis TaxID=561879 RepID=UPI003BF490B2